MFKKILKIIYPVAFIIFSCFLFYQIYQSISTRISLFEPTIAYYTPDGINFTKRKTVARLFGLQDGLRLKDGKIMLTGIDFARRGGLVDKETGFRLTDVGFLVSQDGWKFEVPKMSIKGLKENILAFGDPIIINLPDGNYRMYFTDRNDHAFLASAYSENGYDYVYERKITGTVSLTAVDFNVLYEKRAKKYYIYTRGEKNQLIRILESEDGRNFTKSFTMKFPFYLQFSIIDEGDYYRAYGSHPVSAPFGKDIRYPVLATSKDGLNWEETEKQPVGPWKENKFQASPVAVIKMPDGGYIFY